MNKASLLVIFSSFCTIQALECGIHMNRNEEVKTMVNKCVSSNRTLEDSWDFAPMSSESGSASSEETAVDGKMAQNFRTRRTEVETRPSNDTESGQTAESDADNCIIQCIFENLQMTDEAGFPVHTKILHGLVRNATDRELQDFFQDTTDECFREVDKEAAKDPCPFSVKLITCLAEKGKANCADWPVGDLFFH